MWCGKLSHNWPGLEFLQLHDNSENGEWHGCIKY